MGNFQWEFSEITIPVPASCLAGHIILVAVIVCHCCELVDEANQVLTFVSRNEKNHEDRRKMQEECYPCSSQQNMEIWPLEWR